MKVFVLTWGNGEYTYTMGVFSTKKKAEQAEKFYLAYPNYPNDPHFTFDCQEIELDNFSEDMLTELKNDGLIDVAKVENTTKDKFREYAFIFIVFFVLACLVTGFATILKLLFGY